MDGVQLPQGYRAIMRRQFLFLPLSSQKSLRMIKVVLNTGTLPLSQNDGLVPSFPAKIKILLILAKYSGKIQKQPPEIFYEKGLQLYLKGVSGCLTHMVSCEFCKISKNTFFTEHLSMAVFKNRIYPGIESQVQSRSNLGFSWVLKPS